MSVKGKRIVEIPSSDTHGDPPLTIQDVPNSVFPIEVGHGKAL